MKTIAGYAFPENPTEAVKWEPTVIRVALNYNVLAVARTRMEGQWGAYIAAVAGANHDNEYEQVLCDGAKLLSDVAAAIFPRFADIPYAR